MKGNSWKKKKTYGEYKVATCPFCDRQATQKNEQGLDVCHKHLSSKMEEIKCTCGKWLEQRVGKFGVYFNCIDCGSMNYNKAMEMKLITKTDEPKKILKEVSAVESDPRESSYASRYKSYVNEVPTKKRESKVTYITSNDVEYFE